MSRRRRREKRDVVAEGTALIWQRASERASEEGDAPATRAGKGAEAEAKVERDARRGRRGQGRRRGTAGPGWRGGCLARRMGALGWRWLGWGEAAASGACGGVGVRGGWLGDETARRFRCCFHGLVFWKVQGPPAEESWTRLVRLWGPLTIFINFYIYII